jgi:hypothetical protein
MHDKNKINILFSQNSYCCVLRFLKNLLTCFSKHEIFATPWISDTDREVYKQLRFMTSSNCVWGWPFRHWEYRTVFAMRMWCIGLHDNYSPLLYSFQYKILFTKAITLGRDTVPHFCTFHIQRDIAVGIVTRLRAGRS